MKKKKLYFCRIECKKKMNRKILFKSYNNFGENNKNYFFKEKLACFLLLFPVSIVILYNVT